MIKVGDKLLVQVKVQSITQSEDGFFYRVVSMDKNRCYHTLDVIESDIHSCLRQDSKGGEK